MSNNQLSTHDIALSNIISNDLGIIRFDEEILQEPQPTLPITRIFRDGEFIRCYALDNHGGMAIISSNNDNRFQIVTLGEDDGIHFINGNEAYCSYYGSKPEFVNLLCEALSIFNNNIESNEDTY